MEDEYKFPDFKDVEFWENEVKRYIAQDFEPGDFQTGLLVGLIWEYFKYQWKNQSNYYFEHSLIDEITKEFSKNVFILEKGVKIFRARNFDDKKLYKETESYFRVKNIAYSIESMEESGMTEKQLQESIEDIKKTNKYSDKTKNKIESGFIAYTAEGSGAPPIGKATGGRCNMPGVVCLYAAGDEHTAITEIRPKYGYDVSVATLLVNRDLKLVDCYFDYDKMFLKEDFLFSELCLEFSIVNEDGDNGYAFTRYLTNLIKKAGYDGIRFRTSLSAEGTNFVVFNSNDCKVISSKLYKIQNIRYEYDNVIEKVVEL